MCRLVGVINHPDAERERWTTGQIFRFLGTEQINGGKDSFGWFYRDLNGQINSNKHLGKMTDPDRLPKTFSIPREVEWFVGHLRAASVGARDNWMNAHPVQHDGILGVHNGTLHNHNQILNEVGGRWFSGCTVDSEAIMAAVNRWGHVPGLKRIIGAMVTAYVDLAAPESLHIARTHSRFLYLAWTERGNIIFATDPVALDKLHHAGVRLDHISPVSENRYLKFTKGKITRRASLGYIQRKPTVRTFETELAAHVNVRRAHKRGKIFELTRSNGAIPLPPAFTDGTTALETFGLQGDFGNFHEDGSVTYKGKRMTYREYAHTLVEEG